MSDMRKGNFRWVVVTEEEIAMKSPLMKHRTFIAEKFLKEHGAFVLNFKTLRYIMSKCHTAVSVMGEVGKNLTENLSATGN